MSHELRTPMNAILGFTEMMLDGLYGDVPETLKEPLTDIQRERPASAAPDQRRARSRPRSRPAAWSWRWATTRVARGRRHRAGLAALARRARRASSSRSSVPDDLPRRLRRQRAAHAVPDEPGRQRAQVHAGRARVEIGVELDGDELVYRVSDTGIGIPDGGARRTSSREFRQVDATVTREFGGTGLGLSITKKFVEMHGGRIWVESEVGKGCDVLLRGPAAGEKARAMSETHRSFTSRTTSTTARSSGSCSSRTSLPADRGGRRRGAASRWRRRQLPDLILMDVQLPKMSGLDATRVAEAQTRARATSRSS